MFCFHFPKFVASRPLAQGFAIKHFLLFQSDDFLVLPEGIHLDEAKALLETVNLDNVPANVEDKPKPTTSLQQQPSTSSVLKLRESTGVIMLMYVDIIKNCHCFLTVRFGLLH